MGSDDRQHTEFDASSASLMDDVTISVVIPVYNQERYIAECLRNVLGQTYVGFEIVCVDDGSGDASADIIRSFSDRDERVRYCCQENAGAGPARNNGLNCATGDYVVFVDADDRLPDERVLEDLAHAIQASSAPIVGGSLLVSMGGTTYVPKNSDWTFDTEGFVDVVDLRSCSFYQRFAYKRLWLLENELEFPPYLRFQDPPFMLRAFACAERYYAIARPTYVYRQGHKAVVYNTRQKIDCLQGIADCLELSAHLGLRSIHQRMYREICWNIALYRGLRDRGEASEVLPHLEHAYDCVDASLIGGCVDRSFLNYCSACASGDASAYGKQRARMVGRGLFAKAAVPLRKWGYKKYKPLALRKDAKQPGLSDRGNGELE